MVKKLSFVFILINVLGVLKVNASQYNHDAFSAQLYDNIGGSLAVSSTSNTGASYYGVLNLTSYGTGGAWGISSPTILLANHTYVLTANISLGSSDLALSSINRIGVGTTLEDARVSYQNNTNADELYSRVVGTDLVQFAFKSSINGSYIVFPFTSTTSTQTDIFLSYVNFEDLGDGGLSQTDITNSLNSQTNNINSNSDRNRDIILQNQNDNTDTLNDSLNSMCKDTTLDITTDLTSETGKYLGTNGSLIPYSSAFVSKYIKLKPNTSYTIKRITGGSQPNDVSYCLYNVNKALYNCSNMPAENSSVTFTVDNYSAFLRVSFLGYRAVQVDGSICNDWSAEAQQDIINNNNNNTNQIIQDNQQNTQDIIDNQNSNTQQEIESQEVCELIDKNSIEIDNSFLNTQGNIVSNTSFGITKYFKINKSSKIKVIYNQEWSSYLWFYDINKEKISRLANNSLVEGSYLTIPSNASYVRFSIVKSQNKPQFELCSNGNQALNDSVNNLNDSITSESQPNTNQDINDMNNMVASDTPISDLITMPLTLINAYVNGVNSSCSPINLGNLYGTDLVLPCINLEQRLGSNLWHIIDAFFSIFMCYNIGMLFITAFDGITSLRDDFEGLYQPRHADTGYQPRHGG